MLGSKVIWLMPKKKKTNKQTPLDGIRPYGSSKIQIPKFQTFNLCSK